MAPSGAGAWALLLVAPAAQGDVGDAAWRSASETAHWALSLPLQEIAGCRCQGPWAELRHQFNFSLAHAPDSEELGSRSFAASLCARFRPLALSVLGGDLLAAARRWQSSPSFGQAVDWLNFGGFFCPAGLVAALGVCAVAHAERARGEQHASQEEPEGDMPWVEAMTSWPRLLPATCTETFACRAYVEGLLALAVLPHCAGCLEDSPWPLSVKEVNENAMRWLRWLWLRGPKFPPPAWQGPERRERLQIALPVKAAGAFAGPARGAPDDETAATLLLHEVAMSWSASGRATSTLREQHFEKIFGKLAHPFAWEVKARGPLGVHVKVHPEDFRGPRSDLRFYIYDLPGAVHSEILVQLHGRLRESVPQPATCDYGLSPCNELHAWGMFSSYRLFAAEATILAKLLSAPDEVIVDDPTQASYFVVPFFSSAWCVLAAPNGWVRCGAQRPLNALLPLLTYFNASTAHRHLFLATDSTGDLPQDLQMQPTVLHYGPTPCEEGPGPIVVPPPVTDTLPVPGRWEFSSKDLFLFAVDGGLSERPFRKEVIEELAKWQRALPHLFYVATRDPGGADPAWVNAAAQEWSHQMRRALFCPVLPGDNTFRVRLFHAVLAGCIPVVLLFPGGGWYRVNGPPADRSVPFPGRVDWHGFVVELPFDPAKQGLRSWATQLVPQLLRLSSTDIRERQQRLSDAVPLLRYDFQGTQPDAFTALLDALATRPRRAPDVMDCFDPRQRFATHLSLSGATQSAREEAEIYGIIACCPRWRSVEEAGGQQTDARGALSTDGCDLDAQGVCLRFQPHQNGTEGSKSDRRANLLKHLEAMFVRQTAFAEAIAEDQVFL